MLCVLCTVWSVFSEFIKKKHFKTLTEEVSLLKYIKFNVSKQTWLIKR